MLTGNKKVPAWLYVLNIPLIITQRKNNYIPQIYVHFELAQITTIIRYIRIWFRSLFWYSWLSCNFRFNSLPPALRFYFHLWFLDECQDSFVNARLDSKQDMHWTCFLMDVFVLLTQCLPCMTELIAKLCHHFHRQTGSKSSAISISMTCEG